jgi:hypothetical protein
MNTGTAPDYRSAWIPQQTVRRVRPLGEDFESPRRIYSTWLPAILAFTGIISWLISNQFAMVLSSMVGGVLGCYMLGDWLFRGPTRFSTLIALGLLIGYGLGAVNTWATTARAGLTVGQYMGYDDAALARGIAAVLICCAILIFLGELLERPMFGRDFAFHPDDRVYTFVYLGVLLMLAAFATGSITFNGIAPTATGDIGVFKSFLDWIFAPLVAVALTCFLVTPRGTVRRKLTGVAALTLAVLLIFLGRRVIFYTVLEAVFFARIAGFRLQGSFLKKLFTFALVLGFIVAGTLSFMLLRIAGYGSGPSGHKALGDRIELAVEWVREGTALERTLTTSRSNVQTRTFMLGFFASVLEGSSSRTPGLGVNTIGLMQLAIPSVLYPAKDKFYSEEAMTDRLFGFGYIDEANSLMTNGAVDFGLIGAILYPIAVAAFLRTSLELVSGFMDQFSMLILVLSAIYFALAPETTITAVVDLVLHGVLFSAGILLFVALPRFRLRT